MSDNKYIKLFSEIRQKVKESQLQTITVANSQMLYLYWQLGKIIIENQRIEGWGAKIIDLLASDLQKEFPQIKGFSSRNLLYMKQFSSSYSFSVVQTIIKIESQIKETVSISQQAVAKLLNTDNEQLVITQQAAAQLQNDNEASLFAVGKQTEEAIFLNSILAKISWSHHIILMDKVPHLGKRLWYMFNSLEHGNSRNVLAMQIESGLFERQIKTKKVTNFERTLPPVQSDFANYLLKDPYIFDFVQAKEKADERNIEEQLANQITKFLLELGQGFAFVGRQVHFEIGNSDFYADLLFYHAKLHCYVVVELKAHSFQPGDARQLNFYVNVINDKLKSENDNETIGLLLCKGKNEILAEYVLKGYNNPIGVSDYQISKIIPEELKSSLPQIEDIESEFMDFK